MRLLRRFRQRRLLASLMEDRPVMHLPDDLREPESVGVFCDGGEERIWSALYMARALSEAYGSDALQACCPPRDRELMSSVVPPDRVHRLPGPPEGIREEHPPPSIIFYPYGDVPLETAVRLASLRRPVAGMAEHPVVGLRVRVAGGYRLPRAVEEMCRLLDLPFPRNWRPDVPRNDAARAEALLAPVSGHAMPYIAASSGAADVLRTAGVEIPLKMVLMDSEKSSVGGAERGVRAAVVAGASAVVTDSPVVWSDACALGVPVVGLDSRGAFPAWDREPASDEKGFVAAWRDLLREGW